MIIVSISVRSWRHGYPKGDLRSCQARKPGESWSTESWVRSPAEKRTRSELRLLQPFQALDILLQGYLAVRGWEDDNEWKELRAEGGILPEDSEPRKKAFEVTRSERLFRPPGATEDRGWYWFDECASDVAEYAPFESDYEQKVERIIRIAQERGYRQPTLKMLDRRETVDGEGRVQGALRISWELLRSHYHHDRTERERSRSLLPDCWRGELDQEATTKLFFDAHNEFDMAAKKVEEYLG